VKPSEIAVRLGVGRASVYRCSMLPVIGRRRLEAKCLSPSRSRNKGRMAEQVTIAAAS
jgi:hypothetical protein